MSACSLSADVSFRRLTRFSGAKSGEFSSSKSEYLAMNATNYTKHLHLCIYS